MAWLRRLRGVVGMGVIWAVGWAVAGLLVGVASRLLPWLPWDAFFAIFDAPLPALAVPGFMGGMLFAGVLMVVGRRRRFEELSLLRFTAWGAVGGLLLALVPIAMAAVGLATLNFPGGPWRFTAAIAGPLVVLSAASAAMSLLVARQGQHRELPAGEDAALRETPGSGRLSGPRA